MFKTVRYSEKGSNERTREEDAYMFFIDYLDDCEKGIDVEFHALVVRN